MNVISVQNLFVVLLTAHTISSKNNFHCATFTL